MDLRACFGGARGHQGGRERGNAEEGVELRGEVEEGNVEVLHGEGDESGVGGSEERVVVDDDSAGLRDEKGGGVV